MNRQPGWISITALILAVLFLLPAPKAAAAGMDETELEIEEIILEDEADEDWFSEIFSDEEEPAETGMQTEPETDARRSGLPLTFLRSGILHLDRAGWL